MVAFAGPQAFDVASIKPTQHGRNADGWSFSDVKIAGPGRLAAINASIDEILRWAYGIKEYQVSEPEWMKSGAACFDIEAKAPPSTPAEDIRLMTRTLLAERFGLIEHREVRTLPVYQLVIAKSGRKLQRGENRSGFTSRGGRDSVRISSDGATAGALAEELSRDLDRPVLDKTGIEGSFKIALEWSRGEGDGLRYSQRSRRNSA